MSASSPSSQTIVAESISHTNAEEAHSLLTTAFDRFIQVLESLEPFDWSKSTLCTSWDVHDIVAHQAGGYRSGCRFVI